MIRLASVVLILSAALIAQSATWNGLLEVNPPSPASGRTAIVGATLIDGTGGPPVPNSVVLIRDARIEAVGPRSQIEIPSDAERVDASGLYLLPGLMDAHFHTNRPDRIDALLDGGVTSFRDPGKHLKPYEDWLRADRPLPRAFLTGPHFDQTPHAYPQNAVDLQTQDAVNAEVDRVVERGASAVKIYFRLPVALIRAAAQRGDHHGIPVTAHLELVRAEDAIRAGLDGIEHITSLGTTLADEADARTFEKGVDNDNAFRGNGRYWLWNRLQFEGNSQVRPLLDLMVEQGTYLTPTLIPFEVQPGDDDATPEKLAAFAKMMEFTAIAHRAGVPVIASSHGPTPEANHHELELLVEAGLSPMEAIRSATGAAAPFFGAAERLGAIQKGKAADIVLLSEDPLANISAVRAVERVMLAGMWVR